MRIGISLEPTHSGYRIVSLAIWISSLNPRWRVPAFPVLSRNNLIASAQENVSIYEELILPVLWLLISSLVNKLFKVPVSDLEFVDPKIGTVELTGRASKPVRPCKLHWVALEIPRGFER